MMLVVGRVLFALILMQYVGHLQASLARSSDSETFGECLIDLRLPELLRLKSSLDKITHKEVELVDPQNATTTVRTAGGQCGEVCDKPTALALVGEVRGYDDYGVHQPWQPEEKPSKLQTLFQISITSLSFLSFGGYLLCLIVQAIKSKGTTYFHPIATATTTTLNGGVKRIKIYRRSRR